MKENSETHHRPHIAISYNSRNIGLLVFYFVILIPVIFYINADPSRTHWSAVSIFLANYIIIALLIWINRGNLADFHFDRLSLNLFLVFGTLLRERVLDNFATLFLEILLLFIAIVFWVKLWKSKVQLRNFSIFDFWNGVAVLSGFCFAYLMAVLNPLLNVGLVQKPGVGFLVGYFIKYFVIGLGTVGILEEPIYRGFLWGTLRKMGWKEIRIFFLQALLFWMSHIYYWDSTFTFWVAAPIISLLLGFLAWKSKSIVPSMILHVIYNAFVAAYSQR